MTVVTQFSLPCSTTAWLSDFFSRTLGTQVSASSDPVKKAMLCFVTPELNGRQREVCRKHPSLMAHVASGAKNGIHECKYQFRNRRWNCSTIKDSGSLFTSTLDRGKYDYVSLNSWHSWLLRAFTWQALFAFANICSFWLNLVCNITCWINK